MRIIATAIKLSFKRIFAYKKNLLFIVLDQCFEIITVWLFWLAFLALDIQVASWQRRDMYVFIGFSLISTAFGYIYNADWEVGSSILNGDIDRYLVRPQNPLVMMTLEKINVLGFFLTSVAGITVVAVFAENAGGAIIGIVVCVIATFIISLFFYTIACLAFFIYRVDSLVQIFRALFTIAKYPLHGLNRIIRVSVTAFVPLAFIATIPTDYAGKHTDYHLLIYLVVSLIVMLGIHRIVWHLGRRVYESAN